MGAIAEQTVEAVKKVVECFKDKKFSFSDITLAVRTACEITECFAGLSGVEKKAFAVEVIGKAYREVDVDLPWIPEPFETWIEEVILKSLVPPLIDLIVDCTKGKVAVNQG